MPRVRDDVAARVNQETLVAVKEDSVAPPSEEGIAAWPADVRSVQVTRDSQRQRSTGGRGACRDEKIEVAEVAPSLGGQGRAAVVDAVAATSPAQAGDNVTMMVEEMMENLKT